MGKEDRAPLNAGKQRTEDASQSSSEDPLGAAAGVAIDGLGYDQLPLGYGSQKNSSLSNCLTKSLPLHNHPVM